MIRDEYNKKKQTVKFSAKEERKKKEQGERNYYASQIPKITDMCKALSTSFLITFIFLSLAYAVILFSFIVLYGSEKPYSTVKFIVVKFIVYSCLYGALLVGFILWHAVIKPAQLRKVERYKVEINRINAENLKKMSYRYTPKQPENVTKAENND